jgi:hypothetical protein
LVWNQLKPVFAEEEQSELNSRNLLFFSAKNGAVWAIQKSQIVNCIDSSKLYFMSMQYITITYGYFR